MLPPTQTLWATLVSLWVERRLREQRVSQQVTRANNLVDVCQKLGITPPQSSALLSNVNLTYQQLGSSVRVAHRALAWAHLPKSCLRQCLLVGHLTREAGPALRLGINIGSLSSDPTLPFETHAWLEFGAGYFWDPNHPSQFQQEMNPNLKVFKRFESEFPINKTGAT